MRVNFKAKLLGKLGRIIQSGACMHWSTLIKRKVLITQIQDVDLK